MLNREQFLNEAGELLSELIASLFIEEDSINCRSYIKELRNAPDNVNYHFFNAIKEIINIYELKGDSGFSTLPGKDLVEKTKNLIADKLDSENFIGIDTAKIKIFCERMIEGDYNKIVEDLGRDQKKTSLLQTEEQFIIRNPFFLSDEIEYRNILRIAHDLLKEINDLEQSIKEGNLEEQKEIIERYYSRLMEIPYRQGRSNLSKRSGKESKWEDEKYLTKIGLPNLINELPNLSEEELKNIITIEFASELKIITQNFIHSFLNKKVMRSDNTTQTGIEIEQKKIDDFRRKISLACPEETKDTLDKDCRKSNNDFLLLLYFYKYKDDFSKAKATKIIDLLVNIPLPQEESEYFKRIMKSLEKLPVEDEEVYNDFIQDQQLNLLDNEAILHKIKQDFTALIDSLQTREIVGHPTTNAINLLETEIRSLKEAKAEYEKIYKSLDEKCSKEYSDWSSIRNLLNKKDSLLKEESTLKKSLNKIQKAKEKGDKEEGAQELIKKCFKHLNNDVPDINSINLDLGKLINNIKSIDQILAKNIEGIKRGEIEKISKDYSFLCKVINKFLKKEPHTEKDIENLKKDFLKIQQTNKRINLVIEGPISNILKVLQEILQNETSIFKEVMKVYLENVDKLISILEIDLKTKISKNEEEKSIVEEKIQRREQELGGLFKQLTELKEKIAGLPSKISKKNYKLNTLKKELDEVSRDKEKAKEEIINKYSGYKNAIEILKRMQRNFGYNRVAPDLSTVKLYSLKRFQEDYEIRNIEHILEGFCKTLEIVDENITIIGAIVNFVDWHKELCSDKMSVKIDEIANISSIGLRKLRHSIVHCLNDVIMAQDVKKKIVTNNALQEIKEGLIILIKNILEHNLDYLKGKNDSPVKLKKVSGLLEASISKISLPELSKGEGHKDKYSPEEQARMFISSIVHSKKINKILVLELKEEEYEYEKLIDIFTTEDLQLNDKELKIKIKYITLMKALGEALGTLQMSERLPEIAQLKIESTPFNAIRKFISIVREYINTSTHSGYHNKEVFIECIEMNYKEEIHKELNNLYETIKQSKQESLVLKSLDFDQIKADMKKNINGDEKLSCYLN